MKRATKILLITTALVTASGVAMAGRGYNGYNCDGQGMKGYGPDKMQHMRGQFAPGRSMKRGRGGQGAIYQLDNLTDEQKQQIAELRKEHQIKMFEQREQMAQQRAEMKKQIDAVLTEEQRVQLSQLRPRR